MITGIGTPSNQSKIPRPMFAIPYVGVIAMPDRHRIEGKSRTASCNDCSDHARQIHNESVFTKFPAGLIFSSAYLARGNRGKHAIRLGGHGAARLQV
jgi:hypothetical protein